MRRSHDMQYYTGVMTGRWILQAAVTLSRLWQQHGKCDEVRQLLAPIYGWCTEGFDTADLREDKALLAELS
jgi:predicted ATPase